MSLPFFILLALVVGLALGYYAGRRSLADLRAEHERNWAEMRRNAELKAADSEKKAIGGWNSWPNASKPKASTKCENGEPSCAKKNARQLDGILGPLRNGIQEMRNAVQQADRHHLDSMARLDESIKATLSQARFVGERADRLAAALTGENKTTGETSENSDSAPFWRTWDSREECNSTSSGL